MNQNQNKILKSQGKLKLLRAYPICQRSQSCSLDLNDLRWQPLAERRENCTSYTHFNVTMLKIINDLARQALL